MDTFPHQINSSNQNHSGSDGLEVHMRPTNATHTFLPLFLKKYFVSKLWFHRETRKFNFNLQSASDSRNGDNDR